MSHDHHHKENNNLKLAFFLNLFFTIIEIIGGFLSNSVAILSDAIHDLGDSFSLGLAWYLEKKSKQDPDLRYSFGYARFSLLGALINSLVLTVGSVFIIQEAIDRLMSPERADPNSMILFAILGVAVNGYAAWKMRSGKTLNEKVISWHLIEDVLGWAAILIAAIILKFKYIDWLDPTLSIVITLYILWGVIKRFRETMHLFLQGVPKDVDLAGLESKIKEVKGILSTHDTRIWSLEGEHHVFSTHIVVEKSLTMEQIILAKTNVKDILKSNGFELYTIETEIENEELN